MWGYLLEISQKEEKKSTAKFRVIHILNKWYKYLDQQIVYFKNGRTFYHFSEYKENSLTKK